VIRKTLPLQGRPPFIVTLRRFVSVVTLVGLAFVLAAVVAVLVTRDQAPLALGMLAAIPAFIAFTRYPFVAVLGWITIGQFIVQGEGGLERKVYWVIHRAMPLAVVVLMVIGSMLGTRRRPLPRLNLADYVIIGYVVATLLSVLYQSATPNESFYHVYDRVIAPVGLYFVVRLAGVSRSELGRLLAVLYGVVLIQAAIGALSWVAPGSLPGAWLGREGQRTIGSLGHPNVYGVVMLSCGVLLAHAAWSDPDMPRLKRMLAASGFLLSLLMAFFTFGRANWVAGLVVVAGLFLLYPRRVIRFVATVIPVLALIVASGVVDTQIEKAQNRFLSDQSAESALSRLPVVYASLLMFEAKPVTGFGYGNFDIYDRQFQTAIEGVVFPEKDHASHNLYLTIMAEQGTVGIVLYLLPALIIFLTARRRRRGLPAEGLVSSKLVSVLALCALAHLAVNNFANMRIVYGLGFWWLTLGLLAAVSDLSAPVVDRTDRAIVQVPLEGLIARTAGRS